jgi:Uma2 family endonuclease
MGGAAVERPRMTEEEYLAFERASDVRHELVNGEIVAMAGGSPRHGLIATNVGGALVARLRGGPCRAVNSDVRVHIPDTGLYTYPDITVVCGQPETHPADRDALTNPRVIFEVLSRSTEAYDRGAKFDHYRRCASLAEYVLVDQRERRILHHRRVEGGWLLSEVGPDGTLALPALGCELPLAEIYDGAEAWPADED